MLDDIFDAFLTGPLDAMGPKSWGIVCIVLGLVAAVVGFVVSQAIVQIVSFGLAVILPVVGLGLLFKDSV